MLEIEKDFSASVYAATVRVVLAVVGSVGESWPGFAESNDFHLPSGDTFFGKKLHDSAGAFFRESEVIVIRSQGIRVARDRELFVFVGLEQVGDDVQLPLRPGCELLGIEVKVDDQ